jgi:hypothetical protein
VKTRHDLHNSEAVGTAVGRAKVVGFDADGCVFVCCDPYCTNLLVLAWSQRQIDEAKDKARDEGWFIWLDDDAINKGRVLCPEHSGHKAVRS